MATHKLVLDFARYLAFTLCMAAGGAHAQYFGDTYPPENDNISTRNKVLIFTNVAQEENRHYRVAKDFAIRFIGLKGDSQDFRLLDYYQGQVWLNKTNESVIQRPPYAIPYSGGNFKEGRIDVHDIPIPASIGPIVAVALLPGPYEWKIDKIIADGRTFWFSDVDSKLARRYASHFIFGRQAGDFTQRPLALANAILAAKSTYEVRDGVRLALALFPDAQTQGSNGPHSSSRYPDEIYKEPTRAGQEKIVTLRFRFNDIQVASAQRQVGPILQAQLIGVHGESMRKVTDGPLIFNERFVSFDVPGDFDIDHIDVWLVDDGKPPVGKCDVNRSRYCLPENDGKSAGIDEIGVIVEQGLDPELVYLDRVQLTHGGVEKASLRRFGERARIRFADLKDGNALQALRDRTPDGVLHLLARDQNEIAAINRFRSGLGREIDRYSFDQWFFTTGAKDPDPTDILDLADPAFDNSVPQTVRDAWTGSVRAKLKKTLDERRNALKFIDRLDAAVDAQWRSFDAELYIADKYLGMGTARLTTVPPPAPSEVDFAATFSSVLTGLAIATALGQPEISTGLYAATFVVDTIQTIASSAPPVTDFTKQTRSEASTDQARLSVALANERLSYEKAYNRVKTGLEQLRSYVVKDPALLEELSQYQVTFTTKIGAGGETGFTLNPELAKQYVPAQTKDIRRRLLERLLPIRGVLYGEPTEVPKQDQRFPAGVAWKNERYGWRHNVCGNVPECDPILAYSGFIVEEQKGPAPYVTRFFTPQFHQWVLALGSDDADEPKPAYPKIYSGAEFPSTWAYVKSALAPRDVFNLLTLGKRGRLRIKQIEYSCNDRTACMRDHNLEAGDDGYRIMRLPDWRTSPAGMSVSSKEGRTDYMSVISREGRTDYLTGELSDRVTMENADWLPLKPEDGASERKRYKLDIHLYSYKTGDDREQTAVVPTAWYMLCDRVGECNE